MLHSSVCSGYLRAGGWGLFTGEGVIRLRSSVPGHPLRGRFASTRPFRFAKVMWRCVLRFPPHPSPLPRGGEVRRSSGAGWFAARCYANGQVSNPPLPEGEVPPPRPLLKEGDVL